MELNYNEPANFEFNLDAIKSLEGTYKGVISDVECQSNTKTDYGMKTRVIFTFKLTVDDELTELKQVFYQSTSQSSRFVKFMKMLCIAFETKSINNEIIIDKPIEVEIKTYSDPKDPETIFSNIVSVSKV